MVTSSLIHLKERLKEVAYLRSTLEMLHWDQEVFMPKKGSTLRAETMAHIAGLLHERFTRLDEDGSLTLLHDDAQANKLSTPDTVIIREVWREFEREKKLPAEFVKELAQTESEANAVWVEARRKSDFSLYLPLLSKIVALKKQEAEYYGYTDTPYDALLDTFEPYMTTKVVSTILDEVKAFLVPYLQKIAHSIVSIDANVISGKFPITKQIAFNEKIAKQIGYDLEAGRLDVSAHPFTIGIHPEDVRITTRYDESNILPALMATIHEAGHAMYEQGIPIEHFGTPLGESISLGIHESQSMIWENNVGRSRAFWEYHYPKLQKAFSKPFGSVQLDTFYTVLNKVEPGLIRVEADEVTYNLHIIIRFEIERALIEGSLDPKDLPQVWNQKYKDYLGIDVPTDALGVLQDVHWSHGSIGYFPTYTLGKLYAAQFFAAAKKDLPHMEEQFTKGEFLPFREWLRSAIHQHGKIHSASDLCKQVTGETLNAKYFVYYIQEKYNTIYKI